MFNAGIDIVAGLIDSMVPKLPPRERTPEEQTADTIREIKLSMATLALQGAMLNPSSAGSQECMETYMKLQAEIYVDDLKQALSMYGML